MNKLAITKPIIVAAKIVESSIIPALLIYSTNGGTKFVPSITCDLLMIVIS